MIMIKKVAILLLLAIAFNVCGLSLSLSIWRCGIRQQMASIIANNPEKSLITTIFVPDKLIRHANGKFVRRKQTEVIYFGKHYDVISETKTGAGTFFSCIHDNKEDKLDLHLRSMKHKPAGQTRHIRTMPLFGFNGIINTSQDSITEFKLLKFHIIKSLDYSSVVLDITPRPPNYV